MAEPNSQASEGGTPKVPAPKDKSCPFCGQAFTSSSLGRHLDLYIRDKNPKAPDGIHDVESIRKLRGSITRRNARPSLSGSRRDVSTPVTTPRPALAKETSSAKSDVGTPSLPKEAQFSVESPLGKFPFTNRWEATGVINDLPTKSPWESEQTHESTKRPVPQRTPSKQMMQKAQFDAKQKVTDALDTARAAELALREFISSWRSAKQHIDNSSLPFDFDPLSLDFPSLTLQCLKPPPTLFSSMPHPTSTSWSLRHPGEREYKALQAFFKEELRKWKLSCSVATTHVSEEFTYPPSMTTPSGGDVEAAVKRAEESTEYMEKQVIEHLESAFAVWQELPEERRAEFWVLEMARGVGRRQTENEKLKKQQHLMQQEITNLKAHIDQYNRLQQPREFKLFPPTTYPLDKDFANWAVQSAAGDRATHAFPIEDRGVDLSTIVSNVIGRWKSVVVASRASGMRAQRPLDSPAVGNGALNDSGAGPSATPAKAPATLPQRSQRQRAQVQRTPVIPPNQGSTTSANDQSSEGASTSVAGTAEGSVQDEEEEEEEVTDQDADAEMDDDDGFGMMNTTSTKQPHLTMQSQTQLHVPRTRGQMQQEATGMHFMMPPDASAAGGINMSRSMPNMNMGMQDGSMQNMGMYMD